MIQRKRHTGTLARLILLVTTAASAACTSAPGTRPAPTAQCQAAFDGKRPTPEQLEAVLTVENANLCRADLTEVSIANLRAPGANFSGAFLIRSNLAGAFLFGANLSGAVLVDADFSDTVLDNANLRGASLIRTDMRGSSWLAADVAGTIFEPTSLPNIDRIAYARNLALMEFGTSPEALVKLRKAFDEAGYDGQARELTYAIRHQETRRLLYVRRLDQIRPLSLLEGAFRYVFFELTTAWGMIPGRALRILLALIPVFTVPYVMALRRHGPDGIWCKWDKDRLRRDIGTKQAVRLRVAWRQALGIGLQFSVLSACAIGWRELNLADWIQRLQPKEYTLHATGWVRTVSGAQSLISVYLLALWVLTYFGTPFE